MDEVDMSDMNPVIGAILVIAGAVGYYMDYVLVRFLFRLGHGIAEWLGGPEVVGTGIGIALTLLALGIVIGIFVFSTIGIYVGYGIIIGRPRKPWRRWRR